MKIAIAKIAKSSKINDTKLTLLYAICQVNNLDTLFNTFLSHILLAVFSSTFYVRF